MQRLQGIFVLLLFGPGINAGHTIPRHVIRLVDAAVAARVDNVLGFTDVEHYAVYRGGDETHPAAEMTVKDTYKKGVGKTYTVLSQSGSSILLHFGLKPLLENEQTINQPGNVEKSWFNSANYNMKLKSAAVQKLNGRDCFALEIKPKQAGSESDHRDHVGGRAGRNPGPDRRSCIKEPLGVFRNHAHDAAIHKHRRVFDGDPCPRRIRQPALRPTPW